MAQKYVTLNENGENIYANLLPGNYKFLVEASNNNGIWTLSVRTLNISVLNPPWKTWWAYLI
jgi:hypothetical protein